MNILIYIIVGLIAILLTVLEGIKWHVSNLVEKGDYYNARWWTIFLGKKWEYCVRYEHYSNIKNDLAAKILLEMLLREVSNMFLMDKIEESLNEISKRKNKAFLKEIKSLSKKSKNDR